MVGRIAPLGDGPAHDGPAHDGPAHDGSTRDAGGIVTGWLVRLMLVGGVLGLLAFDAIAVATVEVSVSDQGNSAAGEAALSWSTRHNAHDAFEAAVQSAKDADVHNSIVAKTFVIDPTGQVSFTMTRDAHTLLFSRWSMSRRWTHVSRVAQGHPPAV